MAVYLTELANWLRNAGCDVIEYPNWQTRARGSGGYSDYPLCVMWHHTASPPSWDGQKDADYIAEGDSDAPLANLYIDRAGTVWVLAAGATNTNGKGKSIAFSRGTVPTDSMNTRALGIECGNDGIGEVWPLAQWSTLVLVSNVCNQRFGNRPDDMATHQFYAPDRKVDPAVNTSVQGWTPASATSSGSWSRSDCQQECLALAGEQPPSPQPIPPMPPNTGDDDVEKWCVRDVDGWPWVTDFASYATSITEDQAARGRDLRGYLVGPDGGPYPLDEQDSDLLHRIAGS